jgi:hypothetical protein
MRGGHGVLEDRDSWLGGELGCLDGFGQLGFDRVANLGEARVGDLALLEALARARRMFPRNCWINSCWGN